MARSKPLHDWKEETKRLDLARGRRLRRWQHDKPNGTSFRQLRRAVSFGFSAAVKVKNPDAYLSAHARRRAALSAAVGDRSAAPTQSVGA